MHGVKLQVGNSDIAEYMSVGEVAYRRMGMFLRKNPTYVLLAYLQAGSISCDVTQFTHSCEFFEIMPIFLSQQMMYVFPWSIFKKHFFHYRR